MQFTDNDYKKSSFCGKCCICVEVAMKDGMISVRDSKNPSLEALNFSTEEWNAFKKGILNGEF